MGPAGERWGPWQFFPGGWSEGIQSRESCEKHVGKERFGGSPGTIGSAIALQTLGWSSFMKTLGSDVFFFFGCLLVQCKHGEAVFCLSKQPVPCTGQQKQPQIGIVGTHPCMHHAVWQVFFSKHFSWLKSCHRIQGFLKIRHYLSVPDLADNGCKVGSVQLPDPFWETDRGRIIS